MGLIFGGNSRPVVGNGYFDEAVVFGCFDFNMRTLLRVFNGIIYDVNNDLHDEFGIYFCQKQLIVAVKSNLVFNAVPVEVVQ